MISYSQSAINNRLQGVIDTIDASGNGNLLIRADSTTLSTIQLANPCGTVNGGVLTFSGTLLDSAAAASGTANNCIIKDGAGNNVITGLTVGIPLSGQDVIISNGLNTTAIVAGDVVQVLSAQITGS